MTTEQARERAVELWRQGRYYASLIGGIADALLQVERETAERCHCIVRDTAAANGCESMVLVGRIRYDIREEFGLPEEVGI